MKEHNKKLLSDILVLTGLLFLVIAVIVSAAPYISFTQNTTVNGTNLPFIFVEINSSDAGPNHYVAVDWNRSIALWLTMEDLNGTYYSPKDKSSYALNRWQVFGTANQTNYGYMGKGWDFNGSGAYLQCPENNTLDVQTGSFSISLWFNSKGDSFATNQDKTLIAKGYPDGNTYAYSVFLQNSGGQDRIYFALYDGTNNPYTYTDFLLSRNAWYHVVAVYNYTHVALFVNGTQAKVDAVSPLITIPNYNSVTEIGAWPYQHDIRGFFNGTLDEIMVFSRDLSLQEIRSLYNASQYQYSRNFTDLYPAAYPVIAYAQNQSANRTQTPTRYITYDVNAPIITYTAPYNNSYVNSSVSFNCSAYDAGGLSNITLNIWNLTRDLIYSLTVSASNIRNTTNISYSFPHIGNFTWSCSAGDSVGNATSSANFSINYETVVPLVTLVSPTPAADSIISRIKINATSSDNMGEHSIISATDLYMWLNMEDLNAEGLPKDIGPYNIGIVSTGSPYPHQSYFGKFGRSFEVNSSTGGTHDLKADSVGFQVLSTLHYVTACAWVYHRRPSEDGYIQMKALGSVAYPWILRFANGVPQFTARIELPGGGVGSVSAIADSATSTYTWHHYCGTYNGSIGFLYIDGVRQKDNTSINGTIQNGDGNWVSYFYEGFVDDILVYGRALDEKEIKAMYNADLNKYDVDLAMTHDGNYTIQLYAQDLAGNINKTEARTITIDTILPNVTLSSPLNATAALSLATLNYTCNASDLGSGIKNFTFKFWNSTGDLINANSTDSTGSNANATVLFTPPYFGDFVWNCMVFDTAGTSSYASANHSLLFDNILPQVTIANPTSLNNSIVTGISFNATSSDNKGDHSLVSAVDMYLWLNMDRTNATGCPLDLSPKNISIKCNSDARQSVFGKRGRSFEADDNSADDLTSNTTSVLNNLRYVTACVWVYPRSYQASNLITKSTNWALKIYASTDHWQFLVDTNLDAGGSGGDSILSDSAASLNRWSHVCGTYNGTTMFMYVDGVKQADTTTQASGVLVRSATAYYTNYLDGYLDDVMVFERVLDENEIKAMYNADLYRFAGRNITPLYQGNYTLQFYSQDLAGNLYQTELRTVTFDTIGPNVTLVSPANATVATSLTRNFTCRADDYGAGLKNFTLHIWNSTGSLVGINSTASTGINASVQLTYTLPYFSDFVWNCLVFDSANYSAYASYNYSILFDIIPPQVNFSSPTMPDLSYSLNTSVFVNVSSSDNSEGEYSVTVDWNRSLLLWYRYDDVTAALVPLDNSTYANHGIVRGSGNNANRSNTGKWGKGYYFDGLNDRVSVMNNSVLKTDYITVCTWFNTADATASLVEMSNLTRTSVWYLRIATSKLYFSTRIQGNESTLRDAVSTATITDNLWHHGCGVYDGDKTILYLDGVRQSSVNDYDGVLDTDALLNITIGDNHLSTLDYVGYLDDTMIFKRALSADEINSSYQANLYQYQHNFTGLPNGTYRFKASGQDLSGNFFATEERINYLGEAPTSCLIASTTTDWTIKAYENCTFSAQNLDYGSNFIFYTGNGSITFNYCNITAAGFNRTTGDYSNKTDIYILNYTKITLRKP